MTVITHIVIKIHMNPDLDKNKRVNFLLYYDDFNNQLAVVTYIDSKIFCYQYGSMEKFVFKSYFIPQPFEVYPPYEYDWKFISRLEYWDFSD